MERAMNKISTVCFHLCLLISSSLIMTPNCLFICFSLFCEPRLENPSNTFTTFLLLTLSFFTPSPLFSPPLPLSISVFLSSPFRTRCVCVIITAAKKEIIESRQMKAAINTMLLCLRVEVFVCCICLCEHANATACTK